MIQTCYKGKSQGLNFLKMELKVVSDLLFRVKINLRELH